jgi:CheY-like chemotaxis protein
MKRILVVEDEEDVRTLVELVLRGVAYQVDSVRTAAAAREYIRTHAYDLVLTDFKLGSEGNGVTVADAAAEIGAKVVIVTGYAPSIPMEDRARHEILAKPVRPAELIKAVERQIGLSHT